MKLKKSVAILMALAMLAASGCSSAETDTQSAADGGESAAASTQEDGGEDTATSVELELLMTKPETASVMEEISAKFCEENPGVTINVTSTSDGRTVIQTRLSSNEMPDLMNTFPLEDFYKSMFADGQTAMESIYHG